MKRKMNFSRFPVVIIMALIMLPGYVLQAQDFNIRGRLHMDAFYGISDADAFSNGFNNRRARIGVNGTITKNWDGRIEVDFADGGVSPNDFRLRRSFDHGGRLWVGQYKVPQGLNELTSSNNITFIERASPSNVITDSRRIGMAYSYSQKNLGLKAMVFGRKLGGRGDYQGNMPLGFAFRTFFSPEVGSGRLHLGGSVVYEDLMDSTDISYRDRPEARDSKGGSIRLINAPVTNVENTLKAGFELLYINGPFSLEGEYLYGAINRYEGSNPAFQGYHAQISYVLTGESRSYSGGTPGSISPEKESGAWEVALRYSNINLNDAGINGGEQSNITAAVNYYITSKLRFMANMIYVSLDDSGETPILGLARAQYNF